MVLQLVKGFEALKPIVERIMENPTATDVNSLNGLLKNTSPQTLEKLQDFILAHLMRNVIDPCINPELKCSILECVHIIVENIRISNAESILRLLSFLFSQVFDAKEPTMIRPVSEELKLIVIQCALAIIRNMNEDTRLEIYQSKHVPALSHAVYICVTLAKLEMLQSLRISCLEFIMSLSLISPTQAEDTSDPLDRKLAADAIQFMLPGIVSNITSILRGPITQSSKITGTAVRTLGGVIALVMEDYDWGCSEHSTDNIVALVKSSVTKSELDKSQSKSNLKTLKLRDNDAMQHTLRDFKGRTKEWREHCSTNLLQALEEIGKHQTHPHWKVRKEVAWVSALIIARCPQSLHQGLSPLLNALLHLKGDEQPQIRDFCLEEISHIQDLFAARACKSLKELAQGNMYNLLTQLPRLVQQHCGENTPTVLSLLAGYIELLGSDLKSVFHVAVHLQRFSLSVLQAIVLDTSFVILIPEYSVRELKDVQGKEGDLLAPWIRFKHCGDSAALLQISRLVKALSASNALDLIGRQFLAFITAIPSISCEAALFLNQLLKTGEGDELHHLALLAIDVYLQPSVTLQGDASLSQSQKNIIRICVLTEGIGCCIKAIKSDSVDSTLLRALYPVLERAGSANYLISTAGLQALSLIANATGHGNDIRALVKANMDYICHCVSTRLRRPHENPAVFDALTLLLRHASQDTLPGIRDIVNDVLLRNCDAHQESAHLRVFHTFAVCMKGWLKGDEDNVQEELENDDEDQVLVQVPTRPETTKWRSVHQLFEYHANMLQQDNDVPVEEDTENNFSVGQHHNEIEEDGTKPPPPPPEVLLLELVIRRSLHFIPSDETGVSFLALRTITVGMEALSAFPDVLLPLGHETWSPLVGRLRRDQPPLILRTAFGLLCAMADTCKDFLRPRIVKEVLPELSSVLESSAKKSHLHDKGSDYRFSQLYKLQKAILSRAGHLCLNLQLEGPNLRPLLMASLAYLSCYQPRPLQEHSVHFLSLLKSLDDDLVWWNIATLWGNESLTRALKVPPGNTDSCPQTSMLLQQN